MRRRGRLCCEICKSQIKINVRSIFIGVFKLSGNVNRTWNDVSCMIVRSVASCRDENYGEYTWTYKRTWRMDKLEFLRLKLGRSICANCSNSDIFYLITHGTKMRGNNSKWSTEKKVKQDPPNRSQFSANVKRRINIFIYRRCRNLAMPLFFIF